MDKHLSNRPDAPPVTPDPQQVACARRIEAGLAARAALHGDLARPADATDEELNAIVRDGDAARAELAAANIGLVGYAVHPVADRTGLDRDDLFQEGMLGLMEAIGRFDPRRGSLANIAVPRIQMRVWDAAVTAHGALGLPARRARLWRQARSVESRLTSELSRTPTVAEVAATCGEREPVVIGLLAYRPACSLTPLHEVASDEPEVSVDPLALRRLLRRLDRPSRTLVTRLYGLDGRPAASYADLAHALGCSVSTVRRREKTALMLMRAGADRAAA